jgi:hypothetical protein
MKNLSSIFGLSLLLACGAVPAQQDRSAERNARRQQQQLQALQQQAQQAQADKTKAETESAELASRRRHVCRPRSARPTRS